MKRVLSLLFILSAASFFSQTNINADCINAIPLCSNPSFTFNGTSGVGTYTDIPDNSTISNPTVNPASNNSGCLLSGEYRPQWLLITIGNSGYLEFVFGATGSPYPQAGFYDWAMWKYSPTTCADIQNNTLPPVRCNWNGSSSGGTGIASASNIPQGASSSNFEPPLEVKACEQYIICISNYSGVNALVSFQSIGSASLSCNPNCLVATNTVVCAGTPAQIIAASSSTLTNITYSLEPGGLTSNTPTFAVTPSVTTTYTVYATGQGQQGPVTQTAVSTITVNSQPVANPTFTNATCTNTWNAFDLNLTFTPQPANPNYTITWSQVPNSIGSNQQTASDPTIATVPGIYHVTVTSTGNCSTTTSFTITPPPSAAGFSFYPAGPSYTITCYEPTLTISGLPATYNYTWTNGLIAAQHSPTAHITSGGTGVWTVTAEHPESKCVHSRTIQIGEDKVLPTSMVTPTFQNITCTSTPVTVTLQALSPSVNVSQAVVSQLGGTVSAVTPYTLYTPGTTGTFTHYVINLVNGCSTSKEFTVASSQGFPTFNLTSPHNYTLGCNSRSVITVNIENAQAVPGQGGAVSYSLMNPSGNPVSTSSTQSSYTNITQPGTYTVIVRNISNGCETKLPVSILTNTVKPSLDSLIADYTILNCYNSSTQIRGVSSSPNVSYNWKLPGNFNKAGDTLSVGADMLALTKTVVGTYTFEVTDNSSTCSSFTTITILQNIFPPNASASKSTPSITCKTTSVQLTNNSTTGIQGNFFPRTQPVIGFIWDGPSPQIRNQLSTTYWAVVPGQYTLTARDLNNGCISQTTIPVFDGRIHPVINNPIDPGPTVIDCGSEKDTLRPIVSIETNNLAFQWLTPPGATVTQLPDGGLISNKTGDYRVIVTNTITGCHGTADMKMITGKLDVNFTSDLSSGYAPLDVTFSNLSSSSLDSGSITSVWSFGNGMDTTVFEKNTISTRYTQPGTYMVILSARKGECLGYDTLYINVETPSALKVPNIFTPNGDGINDEFFLHTSNLEKIDIVIADRWGRVVYELISTTGNIVWDGKDQQGKMLPDGVYNYVLKARGKDGMTYDQQGNITIAR